MTPSRAGADGLPQAELLPPPYEVGPRVNWSGAYVGGYLGGAHALWTIDFFRNNNHGHAEVGADGIAGGGWIGFNWHMSPNIVLGVEAELGATSASQSNEVFDNDDTSSSYGMIGALRARAGYAFDRMLLFATAGFAFADITNNIQKGQNAGEQVVSENKIHGGWTIGAGLEYAFSRTWTARFEYVYANYTNETLYNADGNRADYDNELHLVRAGLSYRF
jgi:outer membrane immunogenic protein